MNANTKLPVTIYNLEETLRVLGNPPKETRKMRRVIQKFLRECAEQFQHEGDKEIHLLCSPREMRDGDTVAPFRYISPEAQYRRDLTDCVFWITSSSTTVEHFPYIIHTDSRIVCFDAGEAETPKDAAHIVHNVVRKNNHIGIMSLSSPMNLFERFIEDLLPFATPVSLRQ